MYLTSSIAYPIVSQSKADRQSGNAEWAADLAEGMNEKLGRKSASRRPMASCRQRRRRAR